MQADVNLGSALASALGPGHDGFSVREALTDWMQEIAPYGIFATDAELRVRTGNRWLINHSGLTPEKVIGRSLLEIYPDISSRRLDEHFRRALRGEVSVLSTALHKYLLPFTPPGARESEVPWMLQTVRIAPLHASNAIMGTITIIEDVTQRERQAVQLQRQQEHDRLLSTALSVLLESEHPLQVVADLFPRIAAPLKLEAYFNFLITPGQAEMRLHAAGGGIAPEMRKALAVASVEGAGHCGSCARFQRPLIIPHVQSSVEPHTELIRKIGLRTYAGFPLLIGDRLLGTLSFGSYARDVIAPDELSFLSKIAQYVAISIDRALREQALRDAQLALSEHAGILESKVTERTARLHETIAQLESFSYTVAHDLRAPIRSLQGYCDILQSDFALPEGSSAIVDRLLRASNRLDALTRDLLRFSRISRQDVEFERVDVGETIQDLMLLTPALREEVLNVTGPLEHVWAQRTLLQQCLSNLFDNALKFATRGTPMRIRIHCDRRLAEPANAASLTGGAFIPATHRSESSSPFPPPAAPGAPPADAPPGARIRLWIEDNGIGIAPESHEKIFGIFERVSGHEHIEGTGIGLAIVARAMQQMGGACGVESTAGQGSRFWLEFAAADGPAPVLRAT